MTVFGEVQRATTRARQVAENSGREMFEVITVESTGVGQQTLDVVRFKGPFPRRPNVMYGSEIAGGIDLDVFSVPLCSGSVYRWERTPQGLFVGAYLALRVDTEQTNLEVGAAYANPKVRHTFTLLGASIKDLGPVAKDLVGQLSVREVSL